MEAPARFDDDWEELAGAPAAPPAVPASAAFDVLAFFLEGAMAGAEVVSAARRERAQGIVEVGRKREAVWVLR